ncbi:MAG TPA: DUF6518 family protein [Ktedonobacterales bacterium]|nr:DUF6518 family protein [Ktedonobacterales bacterium]
MSVKALLRRAARRPVLVFVVFVLAGFLYGFVAAHLPTPGAAGVFWAGNFASPWLILAFLAGWSQRCLTRAAAAGAASDVAAVIGFYSAFLFLDQHPLPPRLHQSTSYLARAASNMGQWLGFITPWLVIAILAGLSYGLIGYWWGRSRSVIAGVLVGLSLVLEPLGWTVIEGRLPHPYSVWIVEVVLGMAVLLWIVVARNWPWALRKGLPPL